MHESLLNHKQDTQRVQTPPRLLQCRPVMHKLYLIRPLQCRHLVSDNLSYKMPISQC